MCTARVQPQDVELPFVKLVLRTKTVLPQSQRHSHTRFPFFRISVGRSAISFPNRCPVKSTLFAFAARSFCRHPHDIVFPDIRLSLLTEIVLPQSHLHFHVFFPAV